MHHFLTDVFRLYLPCYAVLVSLDRGSARSAKPAQPLQRGRSAPLFRGNAATIVTIADIRGATLAFGHKRAAESLVGSLAQFSGSHNHSRGSLIPISGWWIAGFKTRAYAEQRAAGTLSPARKGRFGAARCVSYRRLRAPPRLERFALERSLSLFLLRTGYKACCCSCQFVRPFRIFSVGKQKAKVVRSWRL
jgi:hypothetical protein